MIYFENFIFDDIPQKVVDRVLGHLFGAGLSCSRISMRTKISRSTIHRIMRHDCVPRFSTLINILVFYKKIFSEPNLYGKKVALYYKKNSVEIEEALALIKYY